MSDCEPVTAWSVLKEAPVYNVRPGRIEPRAVKRQPKHALLTKPYVLARAELFAGALPQVLA